MAHLPRFLPVILFPFVSLVAHCPASHGTPLPPTYDVSMCVESPIWCGGVEIHYPFYLANSTAYHGAPFSCGYTDLKIACKDDGETQTPVIHLGRDDYTVQNIFYNNNSFLLADADVLRGGDCPRVRHNVSFDEAWLQLRNTSSHDNLTFFFGCFSKQPGGGDPRPLGFDTDKYRINCTGLGNAPGGGASFVFAAEELDNAQEYELAAHCGEIVTVPVRSEVLDLMASDQSMLARGGYGGVLRQGFELAWTRSTKDQCYRCENSGGRCAYGYAKAFLGCLCSGKVGDPYCKNSSASTVQPPRLDAKKTIIGIVASTSSLLFLSLLILAFFLTCKYGSLPFKSNNKPRIESFLQKNGNLHPKRYNYADVKSMTKSFAVKLGQGGFGAVYKGNLSNGGQVAVKMLKDVKGDGEEFMNEVASISRTSHVNVVTLLGFCLQGSKRALIYEYMPNGSLERYTFGTNINSENILSWEKLFEIAIGIARGLEYLHRGCNTRIVHFDIKPHNILLDQDFCPKISDFGLAKLCLNKESAISIVGARGTIGYIAPEVYSKRFGTVSSKSDVYSYGMMVLELVGARDKNINADSESSSQYFPQWIYEHVDEYCISASEINGETTELVRKMILVGLWCIQVIPTDRPTMTRVMEMLEGSTSNLELPPKVLLG
ncbi:LEAF RUST 10 DISEASE-RESISTANCE LOCUS RECEPTOR-LIKE PROTEIN KINASE-like 2.4 isoform X2 [Setaria italica]|uniref:LEAF RUST 10 DISEASE-RESISTANCE LOCUS RECEPTOR-LIKE PROTEIN KINASE-like 2.4 isoform X2 n=1 Tax=Setaria italica TaxID=4555 RepID=UPI000BE53F82|nr:LEAF RUST 10 DISEASE-RESISTANCE LOCUS RECEPTOR-LIKE PROTEIN KINASE-like 2.4 isoform X2 [Setaria italica]